MARFAAFLYSVVLPGARLRSGPLLLFARDCRLSNPVTVGSTGNLIFEAEDTNTAALESRLEPEFERVFGKAVPVLVRTTEEVAELAAAHPFDQGADTRNIVVRLQRSSGSAQWIDALSDRAAGVQWRQKGNELWLHLPDGCEPSRLASWIARSGPVGTFRTYNSICLVAER